VVDKNNKKSTGVGFFCLRMCTVSSASIVIAAVRCSDGSSHGTRGGGAAPILLSFTTAPGTLTSSCLFVFIYHYPRHADILLDENSGQCPNIFPRIFPI
jgi:hypothetical protein